MKIFSAEQIRAWDEYTIREEPVSSDQLMERAARSCYGWIVAQYPEQTHFDICCGKGNNGGDGLAIARLLAHHGKTVTVYVLEFGSAGTSDFQLNLSRLPQYPQVGIRFVQHTDQLPTFTIDTLLIDALYGSGLNRALEGLSAAMVEKINESGCTCIAIDLPSGLLADRSSISFPVIRATHTLCLQSYKLAMLLPENDPYLGQVHLLSIGLHPGFYTYCETPYHLQLLQDIKALKPLRSRIAHKGSFGHALLLCGQLGKMGAAVLAAKGALRTGLGLLSCRVPAAGTVIMQTTVPEAMCLIDRLEDRISTLPEDTAKFTAIGIGPGIGTHPESVSLLEKLLTSIQQPLVLDADALNCLAMRPSLIEQLPAGSVLTPHPKEFARMFGESPNDFDRMQKAIEKAIRYKVYIVLKGHHTLIACPQGTAFFNGSGNAGMATGGMGDVLTGMLTGLLAQGIPVDSAVRLGVYLHGLAGNLAAQTVSEPALLPTDLFDHLGGAWLALD
jgi:ADP-dependent NAD(P)H-hydrate dehydratase / NAD(P)H-hydrate epimerase